MIVSTSCSRPSGETQVPYTQEESDSMQVERE